MDMLLMGRKGTVCDDARPPHSRGADIDGMCKLEEFVRSQDNGFGDLAACARTVGRKSI